jgi:hypothetical protein
MTTLISLVGQQPMPILLPDRLLRPERTLLVCTEVTLGVAERLRRLIPHGEIVESHAYDLAAILATLEDAAPADAPAIVNLTGGTKMMMLAAFYLANQRQWDFVYLESEHPPQKLQRYAFAGDRLRRKPEAALPELISAADYLDAHLPGFREMGHSRDERGALTEGGRFERAVCQALRGHFEVLAGVRPQGVADQIDIDLVVRLGNQVGIAEVKLGGGDDRPKQGIDQLSTAANRDYLGIYTAKFLITANRVGSQAQRLADESHVTVVTLGEYRSGHPLAATDQDHLVQAIRRRLSE